MPTNPNWLEHTERAAWDTVQSLRKQIEQERERSARLAPASENWQKMLDRLDAAKVEHGLAAERYADLLELVCSELTKVKSERDALTDRVEQHERNARDGSVTVEVIRSAVPTELPDQAETASGFSARFARRMQSLRLEQKRFGRSSKKASYDKCLAALELKLEELEDASRSEAANLAVEVATLALRIAELCEASSDGPFGSEDE